MELDKRIKDGKKPLDCFDTENSEVLKPFLQKEGYFSNNLRNFLNLNSCKKGCLVNVFAKNFDCFVCFADDSNSSYKFFIPEAWVKPEEPEKKYRAFSLNEFSELYAIGDVVTYRLKDCEVIEQSMLIGFQSSHDEDIPGNGYVLIGNCRYGFMELFNNYELKHLDHWQPFGIEVEEK